MLHLLGVIIFVYVIFLLITGGDGSGFFDGLIKFAIPFLIVVGIGWLVKEFLL
jgi:hypothetical protein